ncbi:MAG: MFS transporter [Actinobacteria bacterium]|nr:MHS family MFS transporter [Actinomycetota bacterium]PLS82454.1 MAG: MFS transporter [Actinomycetota bacterium]
MESMERLGGEDRGARPSVGQVALASFIGTTVEWYDYFLYGTAAAVVFAPLFFPESEPLIGTLLAFATFGVGFAARPLGGVFFGHFGDRIGRKAMLVTTLLLMGIATFCIGLLPTYGQVGILAPILLVFLRLVQGFSLGGEWGGAVLMATEYSPRGRRGFYGSWPQMGAFSGLLIGTGVFALFSRLPEEQFLAWGWRIPFLLSIVLVGVGLFVRLKIAESPAFNRVKATGTESRMPIVDVFREHPKSVLLAMGARMAENGVFYILAVFSISYVTETVGMDKGVALNAVLIGAAVGFFVIAAFGALSDKVGRRPVYMGGAAFSALFAFPFFWMLDSGSAPLIYLGVVIGIIGHAAMYGPQAAFFSELFGARVRYSGASVGYQLASVLAGGLSPFIAVALLSWAGSFWPIALYMIGLCLLTLLAVYVASETYQSDDGPEAEQPREATASRGAPATE